MRVNLLPPEFKTAPVRASWIAGLSPRALWIFFGFLCAADFLLFAVSAAVYSPQQARMQRKYLELGRELKEVRGIKADAARFQEQSRLLAAATDRKFAWSGILEVISRELPDEVWLESVRLEETRSAEASPRKPVDEKKPKPSAKEFGKKPAGSGRVSKATEAKTPVFSKAKSQASARKVRIVVTGRSAGAGRQTAAVSEYLRRLEAAPALAAVSGEWKVESIRGAESEAESASEVYVFTLTAVMREADAAELRPRLVRKTEKLR